MKTTRGKSRSVQLTFFLLYIVGFGVAKSKRDQKLLDLCLVWAYFVQVAGLITTIIDFYYCWGLFNEMLYSASNLLTMVINTIKFLTCVNNRTKYNHLLGSTRALLWRHEETQYGRKVLAKCEKQALLFVILFLTCVEGVVIMYATEPLLLNIQRNSSDVRNRLLPLKIWFDLPIYESPNFQILFIGQTLMIYYSSILYCCFDNYLALANTFTAGQFSILKYRLEHLCSSQFKEPMIEDESQRTDQVNKEDAALSVITKEFKDCIRQHQLLMAFVEQVERMYTLMNLLSVLLFSLMICLAGYQLIMPGNLVVRRMKFVTFISGCFTQLFSFSFTCNKVFSSSLDVSDGPYNFAWYNETWSKSGRSLTRDFVTMIMRSQRPCYLTAAGFFPITLDTLKSVLTTAFSYLTLIRQSAR